MQDTSRATLPLLVEKDIIVSTPISNRVQWINAAKRVLPIYLMTYVVLVIYTYLGTLFTPSHVGSTFQVLVNQWFRWDTGHFYAIALAGYFDLPDAAFFPLYPMLERILMHLVGGNPFYAGLIVSAIATFLLFVVLFKLIEEDFGDTILAKRVVCYLAIFPTSFFLAAAYNESTFMLFTVFCFYFLRRGNWWLAGFAGFLASLTRSAGLLLVVPFIYEYARQHEFKISKIRLNVLSILLVTAGVGLFSLYCWYHFHNAFAYSTAQASWLRKLDWPWMTFVYAYIQFENMSLLNFYEVRMVIDMAAGIFMFLLVILCFVGPWKFPREKWSYSFYALAVFIFLISFPAKVNPVQSLSRLVMEIFPALIIMAFIGKRQEFHQAYLVVAGVVLSVMLLLFLNGSWVV